MSRKFRLGGGGGLFPRELVSFVFPRELACFDQRHVTRPTSIVNRFELGGMTNMFVYRNPCTTG